MVGRNSALAWDVFSQATAAVNNVKPLGRQKRGRPNFYRAEWDRPARRSTKACWAWRLENGAGGRKFRSRTAHGSCAGHRSVRMDADPNLHRGHDAGWAGGPLQGKPMTVSMDVCARSGIHCRPRRSASSPSSGRTQTMKMFDRSHTLFDIMSLVDNNLGQSDKIFAVE